MDRNIIDYLPPVMRSFKELKAVMQTEQPEFELAWDAADAVTRNLFIGDADVYGISRWERILGLPIKATEDIETRRARVLARLNEYLPYTIRALRRMLDAVCGAGNYSFEIDGRKNFDITIEPVGAFVTAEVLSLLDRILPANLMIGTVNNSQAGVCVGVYSAQYIEYENTVLDYTLNLSYETVVTVGIGMRPTQEIVIDTV